MWNNWTGGDYFKAVAIWGQRNERIIEHIDITVLERDASRLFQSYAGSGKTYEHIGRREPWKTTWSWS